MSLNTESSNFVESILDKDGDLYLKYHFADSGYTALPTANGHKFSLNSQAIDAKDDEAKGLPFSVLPRRELSTKGDFHPWSWKENATWQDHVDFARGYSPGHIVLLTKATQLTGAAIDDIKSKNGRFAIVKITHKPTSEAYQKDRSLIPKQVSLGFLNKEAPFNHDNIKDFQYVHLAAVPHGAYGPKATVYASCIGKDECVDNLVGASVRELDEKIRPTYCPVGASEILSSLGNSEENLNHMSDALNTTASVDQTGLPAQVPPTQTPPIQKAPVQTPVAPTRLKLAGQTSPVTPQSNTTKDPRLDQVEKKLAEIEQKEQFSTRVKQVRSLIDMNLFVVNGKYDPKEHDKAIEDAAKSGWTDEQITRYYGGLLKIKEFEEAQKTGRPMGASSYSYQTPSGVPKGASADNEPTVNTAVKELLTRCFRIGGTV